MIRTDRKSILKRISITLKKLGISPSKEGYYYLKDGIYICVTKNVRIPKDLYPEIAKKYHKSSSAIEKAIRTAIEIGWINCDYNYSEELFSNTINYNKGKPTNYEFIATITEDINLDL